MEFPKTSKNAKIEKLRFWVEKNVRPKRIDECVLNSDFNTRLAPNRKNAMRKPDCVSFCPSSKKETVKEKEKAQEEAERRLRRMQLATQHTMRRPQQAQPVRNVPLEPGTRRKLER